MKSSNVTIEVQLGTGTGSPAIPPVSSEVGGIEMASCDSNGTCRPCGGIGSCEVSRLAKAFPLVEPVVAEALRFCSTAVKRKLIRQKPMSVVAASSLYAACRENRIPLTLKELASASASNLKEIGRGYRFIVNEMEIAPKTFVWSGYIDRVVSNAHASEAARKLAYEIASEAINRGLEGKTPMTLAAAAVYNACLSVGESKTQTDIACAAGVAEVSLRGCARDMRRLLPSLTPPR